jgi:ribonuclease HI
MWGPVVIDDDSIWFCGVSRGTNNTSEIIGIEQALMWLWDVYEATDVPAIMLFDSCYTANMVTGRTLRWRNGRGVGAKAAGGRRGDVPDGALGACQGPLDGRWQRLRRRAGAVGEDR